MQAIYPGSFDPITNGHMDIIRRCSRMFDRLWVVVFINPDKKGMFTPQERVSLLTSAVDGLKNVKVSSNTGLLANFVRDYQIDVVIKGLRAVSDFEYELQQAHLNKMIYTACETLFMPSSEEWQHISSSVVKAMARMGGPITRLVAPSVSEAIYAKMKGERNGVNV